MNLPRELQAVLDARNADLSDFEEWDLGFELAKRLQELTNLEPLQEKAATAEVGAFKFRLAYQQHKSPWDSRYEPRHVLMELSAIDADILDYWAMRADQVKHPILKARYADLLWDLTHAATGGKRPANFGRLAVDGYVEAATAWPESESTIERLSRAFELAKSINYEPQAAASQAALLTALQAQEPRDEAFQRTYTIVESKLGLKPTAAQWRTLIDGVVGELRAAYDSEHPDGVAAERPAMLLAAYYTREKKPEDVNRVVQLYGNAMMSMAKDAMGHLAASWLECVHQIYIQVGLVEEANAVQLMIKEKLRQGYGELHDFRTYFTFRRGN